MSGAMNASMNGPPPGAWCADICWTSTRPPGRSSRCDLAGEDRVVLLADVLAHLDRGDRVERSVGDVAVVLQPDLDPVREAPLGDPLRRRTPSAPSAIVTPTTCDAVRPAAAYSDSEPQPQPMSRCRWPGSAWSQAELAADQVELVALGVLERVRRVRRW